jgi:hypothetical protein
MKNRNKQKNKLDGGGRDTQTYLFDLWKGPRWVLFIEDAFECNKLSI